MARSRKAPDDALVHPQTPDAFTAGFDIGSTSTRAGVWCPSKKRCIEIENKNRSKASSHKHDPGDFTSTGYPFDDDNQVVYLGEQSAPDRCAISLKYAFYILADASDELVGQYALVEPLRKRMNEEGFRARLRRGLVELFSKIWKQIEKHCKLERLKITTISLSVPAQWMDSSGKFTEVYEGIMREVIGIMREVIGARSRDMEFCFVTETEALAHYLLKDHLEELRRDGHRGEHSSFLFLDFGGHNMNGCIFNVVYGEDHDASFYRVGEAFGAGGGSEQWSYNVSELCIQRTEHRTGRRMTAEKKQELVDKFDRFKDGLGPGCDDEKSFEFEGTVVSPEEIKLLFDRAHDKVLKLAKRHVATLSKFKITDNTVVVAGGTAKHAGIKQRLRDMCLKKGVPEPVFVNVDLCVRYDSVKIAKGAAYSASTKISIDDFLRQGAAFGIQRKAVGTGPGSGKNTHWEDSAEVLFSKDKKDALDLSFATGCDEFKIICDPFFGRTGSSRLFYDRCYDVMYIGKLKRGGSRITMSLEKKRGKDFVVLKSEWAHLRTKGVKEWVSPGFTSRPLLLSFDCGPSCFFLDDAELNFERFLAGGAKIGIAARTRASLARQDDSIKTSPRSTPNVEGSQHMVPNDGRVLSSAGARNSAPADALTTGTDGSNDDRCSEQQSPYQEECTAPRPVVRAFPEPIAEAIIFRVRCNPRFKSTMFECKGCKEAEKAWIIPIIHLVYATGFFVFMSKVLPSMTLSIGRGDGNTSLPSSRWYQSDMTTFISVLILISRFLAGLWQATTVWRCIFLLLETKSMSLTELQFISTYQILSPKTLAAFPRSTFAWATCIIILLALPAQLAAPIAAGSITWIPSSTFDTPKVSHEAFGSASDGYKWSWFRDYNNVRRFIVEEAAGLGNIDNWLLPNETEAAAQWRAPPARRPTLELRHLRNGTMLQQYNSYQLKVPIFLIHSLTWVDPQDLDRSLIQVITNNTGSLNITQPDNPLQITLEGVASLLNTDPWRADSLAEEDLPNTTVFSGVKHAALQVKRASDQETCSSAADNVFAKIDNVHLLQKEEWNQRITCYAIAMVNFTAGVVECPVQTANDSRCVLSQSSSALEFYAGELSNGRIKSDPLVDQIFAMMPEVMALMVTTGGFTTGHTIQGSSLADPETFLRNALTVGYQGTWTALNERLSYQLRNATFMEPIPVVVPFVSVTRMYTWLALHLCLTLSSLWLWILQRRSGQPVLVDHILRLLFLDNSEVLKDNNVGLCCARVLTRSDKEVERLTIRSDGTGCGHATLRFHAPGI
ncbi:hypothetical protein CcaCcLH18_09212 [Colletotrichum camelliae]|nr:hypothetical protein CcaCcLH18_09212 [Colletotrichum camelliae]